MMDGLRESLGRVADGWRGLSSVKKLSVILATISVIVVIGMTAFITNKTNYATLYADLSESEAGAIVKELDAQSIKYKVENNGTTILVDEKNRDKFRMSLALENKLPNSSTGFEIFDKTNMMATDEDRKIMYQRAVTGELQRAIEALDSVKTAKVMLVIPDKSIFEKNKAEATASIVVSLAGNQALSESAIQGIGSLVSGAVENLPTKNIKIVDDSGKLLSAALAEGGQTSGTDLASKYQVVKQQFEQNLEAKTGDLLAGVFPADALKLSVNVDLDFDSIEKTTVKYEKPVTRSENVKVSGSNVDLQQVRGGNINDNITNVVGGNGQENNSYEHSLNNELDTETTKVINAPGVVKKISASVLINTTLSPQEMRQLRDIVQSAIGYDANRGDQVAIEGIKFNNPSSQNQTSDQPNNSGTSLLASELGQKVLFILAGLIVVLIVLVSLFLFLRSGNQKIEKTPKVRGKKARGAAKQSAEAPLDVTSQVRSPQVSQAQVKNPAAQYASVPREEAFSQEFSDMPEALDLLSEEENLIAKKEQQLAQISTEKEQKAKHYAKENPDLAAELIKVWMKDK